MKRLRRSAVPLMLILIGGAVLRIAAAWYWQAHLPAGQQFGFGDSESYWQLAKQLASGQPYTYPTSDFRVFRAQGYPLLLAPVMKLWAEDPPTMMVRAYSALLSTMGVGGVFWLGKELFNSRVGLIAALGVACDPGLVALGAFILSDGPCCALLPFQLVLWIKGQRTTQPKRRMAYLLAAGAVAGMAALIRPSWLLFTPLAICLVLLFSPRRKEHLRGAIWVMLGLMAVMAPWWIRNARVTGHFVPTTLQVGASLYDGLHPGATGASQMDFVPAMEARVRGEMAEAQTQGLAPTAATAPASFEYRLNERFQQAALAWATAHPAEAFQLAGVKLLRLWNFWPNEPQFRKPAVRMAVLVSFVPTMLLAMFGAWRFRGLGFPVVLLVLPAVYFTLLHTVFVSSLRYRLPAMMLLYVLAAGVIGQWLEQRAAIQARSASE